METNHTKEKEIIIFTQVLKEMQDSIEKQQYHNAYRCAGFLEAKLIDFGVFKSGEDLPYKEITEGYHFLFWKFKTTRKERYLEVVRRICKEFLESAGCSHP